MKFWLDILYTSPAKRALEGRGKRTDYTGRCVIGCCARRSNRTPLDFRTCSRYGSTARFKELRIRVSDRQ